MKKHISKIMLVFAGLFLATVLFMIGAGLTDNMHWRETEQIITLVLVALIGLFLGLYRIIDLLENSHQEE